MKAAAYAKKVQPGREAWARSQPSRCMYCGHRRGLLIDGVPFGLEIHEMERKSHAPRTWGDRCNYLVLCPDCHGGLFDSRKEMPHARQLALKMVRDRAHYSLETWLSLKPRPETYVTQAEVEAEADRMFPRWRAGDG